MTKLAQLIARREGYGIPNAIPTTHNNPGDLFHSPHSTHPSGNPDSVGQIDTPADGWADLERQLQLYAERGLMLTSAMHEYWGGKTDNPAEGVEWLCDELAVTPDTPMAKVLEIQA